jgi:lipoprotein NlpI
MCWLILVVVPTLGQRPNEADPTKNLLNQARAAAARGDVKAALQLAEQAITRHPKGAEPYAFRGSLLASQHKPKEAVADLSEAIALNPQWPELYHYRGQELFKLGKFTESAADFDKYLDARPSERPKHWQRGISCYYAGKFAEGAKQFETYQALDSNDVENAVWRFLCQAKAEGIEKARASLMKVGNDRRVPLMKIYDLFANKCEPTDVLSAAAKGHPSPEELQTRLFYAHLYLGLFFDTIRNPKPALHHLTEAAKQYEKHGYMGEVARIHRERLVHDR